MLTERARASARVRSEQDLRRRGGLAALVEHLDGTVQIALARGDPLGQRKRIAGLHQYVETPALDLRPFARALCSLGLAHGSPTFSVVKTIPARVCCLLRARENLVEPARELLQARLHDRAIGVDLGRDRLQPATYLALGVGQSRVERGERFVALSLHAGRDLREPLLEPQRAAVGDLREALREHAVRLALERHDGAVELAAEPLRGVLARRLDRVGELLRGQLGVARRRALDGALELLELAPFDLRESSGDPLRRVRLLALDLLGELLLAAPQPVADLVQCATPLDGLRLELRLGRLRDLLDRAGELLAQPGDERALLVALGRDSLRVGADPGLRLLHQLALSVADARDLRGDSVLDPLEILRPLDDTALDLPLRGRKCGRDLV